MNISNLLLSLSISCLFGATSLQAVYVNSYSEFSQNGDDRESLFFKPSVLGFEGFEDDGSNFETYYCVGSLSNTDEVNGVGVHNSFVNQRAEYHVHKYSDYNITLNSNAMYGSNFTFVAFEDFINDNPNDLAFDFGIFMWIEGFTYDNSSSIMTIDFTVSFITSPTMAAYWINTSNLFANNEEIFFCYDWSPSYLTDVLYWLPSTYQYNSYHDLNDFELDYYHSLWEISGFIERNINSSLFNVPLYDTSRFSAGYYGLFPIISRVEGCEYNCNRNVIGNSVVYSLVPIDIHFNNIGKVKAGIPYTITEIVNVPQYTDPAQSFLGVLGAIADVPIIVLTNLFGFDLFGISALTIFMTLLTGVIVFAIVKKVIK